MLRIQAPFLEKVLGYLKGKKEYVFLDTSSPDRENNQSVLFVDPVNRLVCRDRDDLLPYLDRLQEKIDEGYYLAGWVAYEFGSLLEAGLPSSDAGQTLNGEVLADFGVFLEPFSFDHKDGSGNLLKAVDGIAAEEDDFSITGLHPNMEKKEFIHALSRVKEYIAAGDTYQVNYTLKLLFEFEGSSADLYRMLRRNQSVPYGAFIRNTDETILSFSPELFFRKDAEGLTVRPMKGTAARGRNAAEDYSNCRMLHLDPKNRSENVMIVDLLRNDLARLIAGHPTPKVETLSIFDVASYESLLQMTSTVRATSSPEAMAQLKLKEIFRALFPCGSITGAPKIRTVQIIDELEKDLRGVYTGAIGFFGPDGQARFNVPIRTVRLRGKKGEMGIGAGITFDSVPEDEWEESLLKGRFLTEAKPVFHLFETMLWQQGNGFWLLEQHLERLAASADFFKFACNREMMGDELQHYQSEISTECARVRLCLEKDGRISISHGACSAPVLLSLPESPQVTSEELPEIAFADEQVDSSIAWFFHKTSQRQLYDRYMKKAGDEGIFDYIFTNRAGEVTEGSFTNIFIYDGTTYCTPVVTSGLLAGVLRASLLAEGRGRVREKVLTEEDIRCAAAIYLCNSVRGVVQVRLRTDLMVR